MHTCEKLPHLVPHFWGIAFKTAYPLELIDLVVAAEGQLFGT